MQAALAGDVVDLRGLGNTPRDLHVYDPPARSLHYKEPPAPPVTRDAPIRDYRGPPNSFNPTNGGLPPSHMAGAAITVKLRTPLGGVLH